MRCPTCKRKTLYKGNPYRPFCSERCKLIDLDNWLSERYRIPTSVGNQVKNGSTIRPPKSYKGGRD